MYRQHSNNNNHTDEHKTIYVHVNKYSVYKSGNNIAVNVSLPWKHKVIWLET